MKDNKGSYRVQWHVYALLYVVILCSVPLMQTLFYEPSKHWIRMIKPYKNPWLTSVMQAYSVFGDGECFQYLCALIMGLGFQKDYMYLMSAYIINFHWCSLLKSALHHSRPQLDDPSLGEVN